MNVPTNTYRMWDSGLRPVSQRTLRRARDVVCELARQHELLPLDRLASYLGVHVRTLQAAARTGRLSAAQTPSTTRLVPYAGTAMDAAGAPLAAQWR